MSPEKFESVFENQVLACRETLVQKAKEYATDDRLHNFKVAAKLQGTTPRDALCGMMAKHIVSVFDLSRKEELAAMHIWDEKIGDALNYLFLLRAVVEEEYYDTPIAEPMFSTNTETNFYITNQTNKRK
jgi:hypothetical protein